MVTDSYRASLPLSLERAELPIGTAPGQRGSAATLRFSRRKIGEIVLACHPPHRSRATVRNLTHRQDLPGVTFIVWTWSARTGNMRYLHEGASSENHPGIGHPVRVPPLIFKPVLRRWLDWGFGFLALCSVGVVVVPDMAWGARLLGGGMTAALAGYALLMVRLQVEVNGQDVRVRRFFRWRTHRSGDEYGVETFHHRFGRTTRNILLDSSVDGRSRVPFDSFSEQDQAAMVDGIESVMGPRRAPRADAR